MNGTLYRVTADNKAIDKITGATTIAPSVELKPYENTSLVTPVFVITYNSSYLNCNYIYISENEGDTVIFDRYYYVTDISVDTAGRIFFRCAIDVRQTYGQQFIDCPAVITRAEMLSAPTLYPDAQLPIHPNKKNITSIIMPETSASFTGDGEYCYLLTCIGGEPTT